MKKVQKNPVILDVIHLRQNLSESRLMQYFMKAIFKTISDIYLQGVITRK
jgi:hypothetical protein